MWLRLPCRAPPGFFPELLLPGPLGSQTGLLMVLPECVVPFRIGNPLPFLGLSAPQGAQRLVWRTPPSKFLEPHRRKSKAGCAGPPQPQNRNPATDQLSIASAGQRHSCSPESFASLRLLTSRPGAPTAAWPLLQRPKEKFRGLQFSRLSETSKKNP